MNTGKDAEMQSQLTAHESVTKFRLAKTSQVIDFFEWASQYSKNRVCSESIPIAYLEYESTAESALSRCEFEGGVALLKLIA